MLSFTNIFTLAVLLLWNNQIYANESSSTTEQPSKEVSLARMPTVDLIKLTGYAVEEHSVTTEDGYILTMQRILTAKNKASNKKIVFLMPGLGCMSSSFVDRGNDSIAFVLANDGNDVWLGNQRGTPNSMKHKDFGPEDVRFWDFSMDQIYEYDIPAMWDNVLKLTESATLTHIGFATGSLAAFQALAIYPEYNKKIEHVIAMAPMTSSAYSPLPIQIPAHLGSLIKNVPTNFLAYGLDLWNNDQVQDFVQNGCAPLGCNIFFGAMTGYNIKNRNSKTLPNQVLHCPAGTSIPYYIQYMQQMDTKRIQKYDHGLFGNLLSYQQMSPPGFDFTKVTTKVTLFLAPNDPVANPLDVTYWQEVLPNIENVHHVPDPLFTHSDFLWGENAPKLVYPVLLQSTPMN